MPDEPTRRRRALLGAGAAALCLPSAAWLEAAAQTAAPVARGRSRVRPGEAGWPAEAQWQALGRAVGGALQAVRSPLAECAKTPTAEACAALVKSAKNPYFLGDDVALTQTFGWVDAWTSMPSAYAVAARDTADVVAAVNFARSHDLRLVVKGGGHSYQGTSNARDSLLVWTRRMNRTAMHEAFVAEGCAAVAKPVRAVSVGAGAVWSQVYDLVTTQNGGYVQGGGCLSVGVAGLVQSGGFGSFSKAFGLAAGSLLEAEVVTADGAVRVVNACREPELFWALKGGGGGSLGVVTRVTLKVHPLPEPFGAVNLTIEASSDDAFRRLVATTMAFCAKQLVGPHWGEQIRFLPSNKVSVSMVFQGLTRSEAEAAWKPFLDDVGASRDFAIAFSPLKIVSTSAREFWSPTLAKRMLGFIRKDDRPGVLGTNVFWPGDQGQAGQFLHGYDSCWLPAALLDDARRGALVEALFAASRQHRISLHLNKGLAGAPAEALAAAAETALNPAALTAFALVIMGAEGPPAWPGIAGHEPDVAEARRRTAAIGRAMAELRKIAPGPGAYLAESNYFEPRWQAAFWGANYPRLLAAKRRYDPDGLFFVHHGVGSEGWSDEGFTRPA